MTKLELITEIKNIIRDVGEENYTDGEVLDMVFDFVDQEEKNELS